jgi:hypothetical protein
MAAETPPFNPKKFRVGLSPGSVTDAGLSPAVLSAMPESGAVPPAMTGARRLLIGFDIGTGPDDWVYKVLLQPDGKLPLVVTQKRQWNPARWPGATEHRRQRGSL